MRLGIKPTVDIVFKTIFGSEERTDLTLSLVNAVLVQAGRRKALSISLMNPFRLGQHLDQKDAILDVRARDESGREFQLEIQIRAIATLPKRMLHNWA
ncbi:MAG: PD-(D/E)XK nuclease family transposase, partial [Spirochaetaceae bacterium]|nr:PD-(D/E)XK nuclease family transposase [Spirochaetaceae bacterium]